MEGRKTGNQMIRAELSHDYSLLAHDGRRWWIWANVLKDSSRNTSVCNSAHGPD